MSIDTSRALDERALSVLQDLIQTNLDSRDGLREAARNMTDTAVVELFQDIARDRETQAAELSRIVSAAGESPANTGSTLAAAHRVWIDMRALMGGGMKAMLNEAKRGEEYINARYEEALRGCSSYVIGEVLQSHYAAVKATYEAVRFMCEDRME